MVFHLSVLFYINYTPTPTYTYTLWRHGVVVITAAQLYSTKPELRFCASSNPARMSEIRDGEDL